MQMSNCRFAVMFTYGAETRTCTAHVRNVLFHYCKRTIASYSRLKTEKEEASYCWQTGRCFGISFHFPPLWHCFIVWGMQMSQHCRMLCQYITLCAGLGNRTSHFYGKESFRHAISRNWWGSWASKWADFSARPIQYIRRSIRRRKLIKRICL